jgi:predicted DNA repair protein MutK
MSAGLFALLDDVAAIAKLAAASVDDVGAAAGKASAKAAGVVIDDTAVTPQYVQGIAAEREVPIIKKIAFGSLRNKLLIILPVALILAQWAPWAITPILMLGGAFLAYEGVEKVLEWVRPHEETHETPVVLEGPEAEKKMISGAVRTDLILSTEIMVIALNEVIDQGFWMRLGALVAVAFLITIVVYGVVALIVKMDDAGLSLSQRSSAGAQRLGLGMVAAMPKVLAGISVVGTVAMLWVGGHLLLVGVYDVNGLAAGHPGWSWPYDTVHHLEEEVHHALGAVGAAAAWLVNTFFSAVVGLIVGAIVVGVLHLLPIKKKH